MNTKVEATQEEMGKNVVEALVIICHATKIMAVQAVQLRQVVIVLSIWVVCLTAYVCWGLK